MATSRRLEYDKEGDGVRQVRFSDGLPSGVTLSNPEVEVQKRTAGSDPEDWNAAAGVTVSGKVVIDAMSDADPPVLIATDQAVQFQIDKDPDAQPDETDDPIPGTNYRVVIKADRSDAGDVVGKVLLTIHPWGRKRSGRPRESEGGRSGAGDKATRRLVTGCTLRGEGASNRRPEKTFVPASRGAYSSGVWT